MSIVIQTYPEYTDPVIGHEHKRTLIHLTDPTSHKNFQAMVQRAMNTWTDAPPELKEFADLLLDGKVQQDYHSQV